MVRNILLFFVIFFIFIYFPQVALANDNAPNLPTITVINPLRGHQLGLENVDLLESLKGQWDVTRNAGIDAAWLWQYSALEDRDMVQFAKSTMKNQEFGVFLEIDRNLAEKSGTGYKGKGPWYFSDGLLLNSYDKFERRKQIDTVFDKFNKTFGYFPKTVGAWWIGADSIDYMSQKYKIVAVLQCADQFDTDAYSIWGTPWSIPYIPSKNNAAIPAQNLNNTKDNVVILQWATRDPLKGYGPTVEDSTFSVQDYALKQYDTSYFEFLSDIFLKKPYDQTVIGLEGGLPPAAYSGLYRDQLETAKRWEKEGKVTIELAGHFAEHFLERGEILPNSLFLTKDYKSDDQSFWYHSPYYRVSIQKIEDKIYLIDLRDYSHTNSEDFNTLPNTQQLIRIETKSIIDSVRNPNQKILLATSNSNLSLRKNKEVITLTAGDKQIAKFSEKKAAFSSKEYKNTFEFSRKKFNNLPFFAFTIIILSYFAYMYFGIKNKNTLYSNLSFLLLHILILLPIFTSGSFLSNEYLFDDRFINLLKIGSTFPTSPVNKILIIFQLIPALFIVLTNLAVVKFTNKFSTIFSVYSGLFLVTILVYTSKFSWFSSLFQQGLRLKLLGVVVLAIAAFVVFAFYKLYKSQKTKLLYTALGVLVSVAMLSAYKQIFNQKRIIITPFEMEGLTAVYKQRRDVIFVKHTTISQIEEYRAVRPLLFVDSSYGQILTGVKWKEAEQIEMQSLKLNDYGDKLLFLPRYLGSSISTEDIKKYTLSKIFDNAQIAIFRDISKTKVK